MTFVRKLIVTSALAMGSFAFSVYAADEAKAGENVDAASNRICACIESGDYANCGSLSSTDTQGDEKKADAKHAENK